MFDDVLWHTIKYFNYSYLRKSFQTVLLNKLEKRIGSSFRKMGKNPPEGMTPKLVRNMTDSDLLDMHYFLTKDHGFDDESFYIDFF